MPQPTDPAHFDLTLFPRMECARRWSSRVIPAGDGWHDAWVRLLLVQTIAPAGSKDRSDRWTRLGKAGRKPLTAKECASGIAPYLLGYGMRRCKADVVASDRWTHVVHDIDAAPLTVDDLLAVVERGLGAYRHLVWTTWSSRDGYASARVFIPLSRTCSADEAAALWWWSRRRLLDAGLPVESAKAGEPCDDSRAMDGRLFYLPSVPAGMVPGTEGWGGVRPRGMVSPDDAPVLDVDALLTAARVVQAEDEDEHLARFPGVPVPGGKAGRGTSTGGRAVASSTRGAVHGASGSEVEHSDWGSIKFAGTTLLAWCEKNLSPGSEASVGSPWRPDGGSGEGGRSLRIHRDPDGRLWGKDFTTGRVHVHGSPRTEKTREYDEVKIEAIEQTIDFKAAWRLSNLEIAASKAPLHVVPDLEFVGVSESSEEGIPSSERSDTSLSRARTRLDDIGQLEVICPMVRTRVIAVGNSISAKALPCGARSCPACGPVIRRAEAAAAAAHLGDLAQDGWEFLALDRELDDAEERRVRRWRQGREDRGVLVIPSGLEGVATTLLLAVSDDEEPIFPPFEGAELIESDAVADLVEELIMAQTWGRRGTHGLRGDRDLVGAICLIRDALLGRERAKRKLSGSPDSAAQGVSILTSATIDEVREVVEEAIGAPLSGGMLRRRLGSVAVWLAPEGVDLESVLRRIAREKRIEVLGRVPASEALGLPFGCLTPEGAEALLRDLMAA